MSALSEYRCCRKDITYLFSCRHSRHRAQDPGTTLEELITIGRELGIIVEGENARSRRERLSDPMAQVPLALLARYPVSPWMTDSAD